MKYLLSTLVYVVLTMPSFAYSQDLCDIVHDAVIIAQDDDNTYLGKISGKFDSDSIFNEYGDHGSQYSTFSIWNQYGEFGSKFSTFSANNSMTSSPPMIIKNNKVIGYLTTNKNISSSVSPNLLKALCADDL